MAQNKIKRDIIDIDPPPPNLVATRVDICDKGVTTFAETANVYDSTVYCLPIKENKPPLSISRIYIYLLKWWHIYIYISIYKYTYTYIYIYILLFQTENGKRKPRRFVLIRCPFVHCANGSLWFFRLFMKKQTEVIRLQTY